MAANRATISDALPSTLAGVDQPPPWYRGKVRDVFERGDELLLVATDRVSAFDVVLGTIPFKGQLLTEQAAFWLAQATDIIETHLIDRPDPQAMRVTKTAAIPVELVVRGYLAGSLLREPSESRGRAFGLRLDPALLPYAAFPEPVVTPTTKEAAGAHDLPCSLADLVASGRVCQRHLDRCVEAGVALFRMGQAHAAAHGLLLVDTKYEMGLTGDRVVLIDEIHTADSSRFWVAETYQERVRAGAPPDMLDKERLRRWLVSQGFSGHGAPPALTDEVRVDLALHYWELTERVMGRAFAPITGDALGRVTTVVRSFLAA